MDWAKIKSSIPTNWGFFKEQPLLKSFFENGKTPKLIQIETMECGSIALGIIMGYYNKFISSEELRLACGVSRNGSKAKNILKAARNYGMLAHGAQIENLSDISKDDFPFIAFWEFSHFVVIEKFDDKYVYINDPAQGYVSLPHDAFSRSFTGVILIIKPGPTFITDGRNPFALPPIKPIIRKYSLLFIFMGIAAIASLIPAIIIPGASKIVVDDILVKHYTDWFRPLSILVMIVSALGGILIWLEQAFLLRLNISLTSWLATRFVWHTLNLPLSFFASRYSGDILLRIKSIFGLTEFMSSGLSTVLSNIVTAILYLFLMAFISLELTATILLITAIGAAIAFYHKRHLTIQNHLVLGSYTALVAIEIGGLQIIESLKASGTEFEFLNKRAGAFSKNMQNEQTLASYEISLEISTQFLTTLSNIILIGYGATMIMNGQLTIGTFIAFQILATGFTTPLRILSNLSANFQETKMNLIRLKDTLNYPAATETTVPKLKLKEPLKGSIHMENVSFSYSPADPPILKDISLDIPEGSTCALVGRSGSGKSTLGLLMVGLTLPTSGKVLIDTIPIEQLDQETRKKTISMVDGDLGIFEGTLQDNITLFQKNVSPKALDKAIEISCLEDVVERIGGLQGFISEGGSNLSGGQRQRIEIGRILFQGAKILILDEATSNLDHHRELQILANLKKMGYTLIIISHRLTTIQNADMIFIVNEGEIVERGKHSDLITRSDLYKELVSSEEE